MSELSGAEILAGALDGGDWGTAAACILALPESEVLPRVTIERMFKIAMDQVEPTRLDITQIEAAAKVIGGVA